MNSDIYSVRMRASSAKGHLSGAERLVSNREVGGVVSELTNRALSVAVGNDVKISCSVEKVDFAVVQYARLPDLQPFEVRHCDDGRVLAKHLLECAGVPELVAMKALSLLSNGAGPGGAVMRGAVIMDAQTGNRLEDDPARGVRASRMDLTSECRETLEPLLRDVGLNHRRVLEALTLSGKVLNAPGIVAELCWSDDPGYTSGYVASPARGYQRISAIKRPGDPLGGRVFLVNPASADISDITEYLEKQPVLLNKTGKILPQVVWNSEDE